MHKPAGVTSTVSDRHAERTVLDLLPPELRTSGARLYPVGRLDRDSEGLILLTDDGDWTQQLLHPRYGVEREYAVGAARYRSTQAQASALSDGIEMDEGLATLAGLRLATRTETARLAARRQPCCDPDLVSRRAHAGLAPAAAAHVRGRRRPRGAPRPGAHRHACGSTTCHRAACAP